MGEFYRVNGEVGEVNDVERFLADYPNAIKVQKVVVDKDTGFVSVNGLQRFLQDYPNAEVIGSSGEKYTIEQPETKTRKDSTYKEDNVYSYFMPFGNRGYDAAKTATKAILDAFASGYKDIGTAGEITANLLEKIPGNPFGVDKDSWRRDPAKWIKKTGKQLQDLIAETIQLNPEYEDEFITRDLPQAFGSIAAFALAGKASIAAKLPSWVGSAILGAASMSSDAWDEAIEKGADEGKATLSFIENFGWGLTEAFPVSKMFSRWNKWTGGGWLDTIKKAGLSGLEEMIQESAQTIGQNWTAQRYYDATRELFEGVERGGAAGFVSGMMLSALGNRKISRRLKKMSPQDREIEIKLMNLAEGNIKGGKEQFNKIKSIQDVQKEYQKRIQTYNEEQQKLEEEALQDELYAPIPFNEIEQKIGRELTADEVFAMDMLGVSPYELGLDVEDMVAAAEGFDTLGDEVAAQTEKEVMDAELSGELAEDMKDVVDQEKNERVQQKQADASTEELIPDNFEETQRIAQNELNQGIESTEILPESIQEETLGEEPYNTIPKGEESLRIESGEESGDLSVNLKSFLNWYGSKESEQDLDYDKTLEKYWKKLTKDDKQRIVNAFSSGKELTDKQLDDLLFTKLNGDDIQKQVLYHFKTGKKFIEELNNRLQKSKEWKDIDKFNEENREYIKTYQENPAEFEKELRKLKTKSDFLHLQLENKRHSIEKEFEQQGLGKKVGDIVQEESQDAKLAYYQKRPDGTEYAIFNITKEGHPEEGSSVSSARLQELGLEIPAYDKSRNVLKTEPRIETNNNQSEPETKGDEVSEQNEPRTSANTVINKMVDDGIVNENSINETIDYVSNKSKTSTLKEFEKDFNNKYKDHKLTDQEVARLYRTEKEKETMEVLDVDFVTEKDLSGYSSTSININPSTFINHRRMKMSNKYLVNDVIRPYLDRLIAVNIFDSNTWNPASKNKYKNSMPFNRKRSLKGRDLLSKFKMLEEQLEKKGYTLLPISDSDTFLAMKIDDKYKKMKKQDLLDELIKRYPANEKYYKGYSPRMMSAELSHDDMLKDMLGLWYDGNMQSSELAKRFKLFLPKGYPLSFHRKIKVHIAPDIMDEHEGEALLVSDGNTLLNPKFSKEFNEYNSLGDVKQLKTIVTESTDNHLIALKHLMHTATSKQWKDITKLLGVDPNVDMITFDSSAKISEQKSGEKITDIELDASSFRHIFSGSEHDFSTFTRQIFNFVKDLDVSEYLKTEVVAKIAQQVNEQYADFEIQPQLLVKFLKERMNLSDVELTAFRRYVKNDAVLFRQVRNNLQSYLKNHLIVNQFIKMRQEGNFSYLKPDYFNEVKRGEIFVPNTELEKIAGYLKVDISGMNKADARTKINDLLAKKPFEVLTFRPPVPRLENVQVLRVSKILDDGHGNAAVMNTKDSILNKEADFDGDEVFFVYSENNVNLKKLFEHIKEKTKEPERIRLKTTDSGSASVMENRIKTGVSAGLGKKAIGEVAKAIGIRSILEQNDAVIIEYKEKFYLTSVEGAKSIPDAKIYNMKKDLSKWDKDIAITAQAAVDNLKENALHSSDKWFVKTDESGSTVDYNRGEIYASLFDGISAKDANQALDPIHKGLEVFSKDFDNDADWSQSTVNKRASEYAKWIENNGFFGKSPQEEMIVQMASMGYLIGTDSGGRNKKATLDSEHFYSHRKTYKNMWSTYVNKVYETLDKVKVKEIQDKIKKFYEEKSIVDANYQANLKAGFSTNEEVNYDDLYEKYLEYAETLSESERDYFDYLAFKGFPTPTDNFGLGLLSDKNLALYTDFFNKKMFNYAAQKKYEKEFAESVRTTPPIGFNTHQFYMAIKNLFGIHSKMEYTQETGKELTEVAKEINKINKQLYKIGKLPFSDFINMETVYKRALEKKGKTLGNPKTGEPTKIELEDATQILEDVRELYSDIKNSNMNSIKKYFYFTKDLLEANPYTRTPVKQLDDASNLKDANSQNFLSQISNIKTNEAIREKLDLFIDKHGNGSRMAQAEEVLNLYNELQVAKLTENEGQQEKVQKKIDGMMSNSQIRRQVEVIRDVVSALNGLKNVAWLKEKYGENVVDAFNQSRKFFNEVIEYDRETHDVVIGDANDPKSWQYKQIQLLRKFLAKQIYTKENIIQMSITDATEIIKTAVPGSGVKYSKIKSSKEFKESYEKNKDKIGKKYSAKHIENIVNLLIVKKPEKLEDYYPHIYFNYELDDISKYKILENFEGADSSDLLRRVKGLNYWKNRTKTANNQFKYVDQNMFTVMTRRANASINARWSNRFRSISVKMLENIYTGIEKEIKNENLDSVRTLMSLKGVVDAMINDVNKIPQFGWWKSMGNIMRNIYLSNLLLLSTRGTLRNASQGIAPNLIEFGASMFKRGHKFRRSGYSKTDKNGKTIGGKGGDVILSDEVDKEGSPTNEVINVFDSMGLARADIFAKVEGGQEWDIYSMLEKANQINAMKTKGTASQIKFYLDNVLQETEKRMNKAVKIIGENNIFSLSASLAKRWPVQLINKVIPYNKQLSVPEISSSKVAFSSIEYRNRELTASMAFVDMWETLTKPKEQGGNGAPKNKETFNKALVHARNMVDKLQYNYNMWNRPRALRKLPLIFQFKSFLLGTLKLHWSWAKGVAVNPSKNIGKAMYFSAMSLITAGLEEWLGLGFFRFFELPEKEYFENLYELWFGNRNEREWAFYGNRLFILGALGDNETVNKISGALTPLSAPIGGMVFEGIVASGIWGASSARRRNAYYRLVESHFPVKEINELYARAYRSGDGFGAFAREFFEYFGLYQIYKEPEGLSGVKGLSMDSGKYKGPLREYLNGRSRIWSN